jgi:bifunctional non-homologous end joining protein LigD
LRGVHVDSRRRGQHTITFDVLWLRGRPLQQAPHLELREELEGLPFQSPLVLSPQFDDGPALFEQTLRQGYEGFVAKRRTSLYQPGVRTRDWIKTKHGKLEEVPARRVVSAAPPAWMEAPRR